jgi:nicotinate dehydrogenase subunit A
MTQMVGFTLNGAAVHVCGPPAMPLIHALRGQLNHLGTRLGCGTGDCGACTVTLDGLPVTSCNLPLSAVAGRQVGTIEAVLAADHPLVAALIRHQAGQCGYCLTGIVMRATALLDAGQDAAAIREALDANLCRCGAHSRIMAAIAEVAT